MLFRSEECEWWDIACQEEEDDDGDEGEECDPRSEECDEETPGIPGPDPGEGWENNSLIRPERD